MSRIRDGNNIKPPRNLIDLIAKAKEAQLRAEERIPRELADNVKIIEADAIRRAQRSLSEQRVQDTLLAEVADLVPIIEKFRDGKAEHNEASLSNSLGIPEANVRTAIKPLIAMGFLEETGGSFKIPMLYRDGLQITQGKAFGEDEQEED
jgi:Fic family protein